MTEREIEMIISKLEENSLDVSIGGEWRKAAFLDDIRKVLEELGEEIR